MKNMSLLFGLLSLALLTACGCRSPYASDRLGTAGGLAGAGIGAAIGEHNDNPLAGAAIGGIVGAVAGGAVGNEIDIAEARNRAVIEQRIGRQMVGAVTVPDVITMTQAGLGDQVIITHIRANGVAQIPQANDLIAMKQQGVSDGVINAMQSPPQNLAPAAAVTPVIVEERYVVPPYCPSGYYRYHHHHHHRPRRHHGSHIGFSFHN